MKGDYYRYLAEFKTGEDRQGVIADALTSYKAVEARAAKLVCTHAAARSVCHHAWIRRLKCRCYQHQLNSNACNTRLLILAPPNLRRRTRFASASRSTFPCAKPSHERRTPVYALTLTPCAAGRQVFHYEIMGSPDLACSLAKQAFDDAIAELGAGLSSAYGRKTYTALGPTKQP